MRSNIADALQFSRNDRDLVDFEMNKWVTRVMSVTIPSGRMIRISELESCAAKKWLIVLAEAFVPFPSTGWTLLRPCLWVSVLESSECARHCRFFFAYAWHTQYSNDGKKNILESTKWKWSESIRISDYLSPASYSANIRFNVCQARRGWRFNPFPPHIRTVRLLQPNANTNIRAFT